MAINFPTSLDSLTNPSASDALDSVLVPHATQHSDLNDAVEALEAKVGVNGSAVTTSLDYKVSQLETDAVSKTLVDAKGDLLVGTADDTMARLAVGANGYGLVADSAQTSGLRWAAVGDVTLTGTQTLTNKTLTEPVINSGVLKSSKEPWNLIGGSGPTGALNIDADTSTSWQWTYDSTGNTTFNFRWNSGTTLDSKLDYGDSITFVVSMLNGATAYYPTAFSIDGTSVTPKWQGGVAPTAGNASSRDIYVFTLVKGYLGWDVYASQTQFA